MARKIKAAGAIFLALVMLLNAAGCAGEVRRAGGNQEEFEYLITVGFAQGGEDSSWKRANTESFQSTFIEENGYKLLFEDAGNDQQKQIEIIRSFIEEGVDYILLAPAVEYGWEEILEEVKEARIPVLLVGALDADIEPSLYECHICSDIEKQVQEAGKWLEQYLEEHSGKEENSEKEEDAEKSPYILTVVQDSIGTVRQLTLAAGYQKLLEKHDNWQMEGQQTGENNREIAKEVAALFLDHYPEMDIIIAETSAMALGIADALESRKDQGNKSFSSMAGQSAQSSRIGEENKDKNTASSVKESGFAEKKDIIVISLGAGRDVLEAVRQGKIQAAFEQTPLQAPKTAEVIQKLESGIYLDETQYVSDTFYDQSMDLESIMGKQKY